MKKRRFVYSFLLLIILSYSSICFSQNTDSLNYITLNDSNLSSGSVYKFDSVSFVFAKRELTPKSYIELDIVFLFLQANSDINVEIVVYGFVYPESSNILPMIRAREIFEYLIEKGVEIERLTYKGFCCEVDNIDNPKSKILSCSPFGCSSFFAFFWG